MKPSKAVARVPQRGGVLVIDKPRGPTSHDVVARLRRALGTREIGHAGTLDPMATGVLVIAIGEATKLAPYLTAADKTYEATLALGAATDTLDAEGTETERAPVSEELRAALSAPLDGGSLPAALERAFAAELARTLQTPPAYSAIKQDGERSYALARRGEAPELAPRPVLVFELTLLAAGVDRALPWMTVGLRVSKGYYVRSLARDLAAALGTVAHLTALRRTRSGCFAIEEAVLLDTPPEELAARVLVLDHAASRALPVTRLSALGARDARFGRPVRSTELDSVPWSAGTASAWLDPDEKLVAIGERLADGTGRVLRGFAG